MPFRSTLLHEERPGLARMTVLSGMFRSTLLHEERQEKHTIHLTTLKFRSTLLHEERQLLDIVLAQQPGFDPRSCTRIDVGCFGGFAAHQCFDPRSCTRSDSFSATSPTETIRFDPRSCTRSDPRRCRSSAQTSCFDPRSCTRSDPAAKGVPPAVIVFRSTLLHEELTMVAIAKSPSLAFRSTLLHEERRAVLLRRGQLRRVSIPAPARGATGRSLRDRRPDAVSIHAPARGATLTMRFAREIDEFRSTLLHEERRHQDPCSSGGLLFRSTLLHEERPDPSHSSFADDRFRSTLLHEERLLVSAANYPRVDVSIHAPARGATGGAGRIRLVAERFDPRSCTRSDPSSPTRSLSINVFRSTLLHEERHWSSATADPLRPFRSTLLHEERRQALSDRPSSSMFRSTLLHEERPSGAVGLNFGGLAVSIHAPARGATNDPHVSIMPVTFRSTLLHEERPGVGRKKLPG